MFSKSWEVIWYSDGKEVRREVFRTHWGAKKYAHRVYDGLPHAPEFAYAIKHKRTG